MVNIDIISNGIATFATTTLKVPQVYYGMIIELIKSLYLNLNKIDLNLNVEYLSKLNFNYEIDFISIFGILILGYLSYIILSKLLILTNNYLSSNFEINYLKTSFKSYFLTPKYEIVDIKLIHKITNNYLFKNNYFVNSGISLGNCLADTLHPRIKSSSPYDEIVKLIIPSIGEPYHFYDKKKEIRGYIIWRMRQLKEEISEEEFRSLTSEKDSTIVRKQKSIDSFVPYIEVFTQDNPREYCKKIIDEIDNAPETIIKTTWYNNDNFYIPLQEIKNGNKNQLYKELYRDYILTFFHPKREELWNQISKIHFNPEFYIKNGQYPQISLLLYGPPGTGKSSFAYRIAKALQRNIVEINLMTINSKRELRTILMDYYQQFNDVELNSNDSVIVLDEFDLSIEYLEAKEKLKKQQKNELLNKIDRISEKLNFLVDSEEEENQNQEKLTEEIKVEEKLEPVNDEDDELTLNDLLNIFQGPIANHQSIIIATTNKFHKIYQKCPRLFRDGRLKPYYFGYATKETLNQITKFYFDEEILDNKIIPEDLKVTPSRITHLALTSLNLAEEKTLDDYDKLIDGDKSFKGDKKKAFSIFIKELEKEVLEAYRKKNKTDFDEKPFDN
jgi:adenylate kinase family enzyme